ncbi:MAG: Zn-ribbon domain-containing OB-fold protein [Burkholderiales bacterium]
MSHATPTHTPADEPTGFEQDPFAAAFPETREFWAAAEEGRLMLNTCEDCKRPHWYPRAVCPLCGSTRLRWVQASGQGSVYAFSTARRATPPYTLAYVQLAEGPTLLTNIVQADPDTLKIGMPVSVQFQRAEEGRMMPFFRPADAA